MSTWVKVLALVALLAGSFGTGVRWQMGVEARKDLAHTENVIATANEQQRLDGRLAESRAKQATIYRDRVIPIVERLRNETFALAPASGACRVSPDGMRDIATLIDSANAAGGSAPTLPAPAPAGQ